jgi:type III secretion system YscD/HrpQ family protein
VAEHHVLLNQQEGRLQLIARDQAVWVGAYELPSGESTEIPAGTVFGLGVTHLALGPPGTAWLSLPLPGKPATSDEAASAAEADSAPTRAGLPIVASPPSARAPASSVDRLSQKSWIAAGLVVLLAFIMALFRHELAAWLHPAPKTATTVDHVLERAEAIVDDLGMTEITVSGNRQGAIVLRGYSDTEQARRRLLSALKDADIPVINQVRAVDMLQRALQESLDRLGAGQLTFDYLGQGAVRLHGFLDENLNREELVLILKQDVPAIQRIEADIGTLADRMADLRKRLQAIGISDEITVSVQEDTLHVDGVINASEASLWQKVREAFLADVHGALKLTSHVTIRDDVLTEVKGVAPPAPTPKPIAQPSVSSKPPSPSALRLSIRGVVLSEDKPAYALLDNGLRVSAGDALDENHVVDAIEIDRIVIRSGEQTYVYYIGEGS